MSRTEIWTWSTPAKELTGFDVEATDGSIGKVDEATYDPSTSCLVVDTGFWIFGKKRMLPAGVVDRIDTTDRKLFINRTKEQVKNAPDYDAAERDAQNYRDKVGDYWSHS
jgi:hypothetical protein